MNTPKLETLLEKVHVELQKVDKVDAESLNLLRELEQDVHTLLERTKEEPPGFVNRIKNAIDRFEVDHPTLTALLSEVSTILSNAGI